MQKPSTFSATTTENIKGFIRPSHGGRVAKLKYWWRSLVMQRVVIAGEKVLAFTGDFRG
jgi:hypothetical protein